MIQDIFPHKFNNVYKEYKPEDDSYVFIFDKDTVYLEENNGEVQIPVYNTLKNFDDIIDENLTYLFTIDNQKFFLLDNASLLQKDTLAAKNVSVFRELKEDWARFAVATALHLYRWYSSNKYCGTCGKPNKKDDVERALYCPCCNKKVYPTIAPVIMVGIVNKDKILLTKYASGGYKKFTLVAGFAEIGESFEETVKREVMEEVGLKVKNIRYYKSQPWAYSGTMMTGFFADLDGTDEVNLDTNELAEGKWFKYDEMPAVEEPIISLNQDMMLEFYNKKGNV
ncbi:MAG TPA: NAD(+) diphosphatase [Clostridium sp.]|nr:NAD(+) diphosphatase [Clostridium sp.]